MSSPFLNKLANAAAIAAGLALIACSDSQSSAEASAAPQTLDAPDVRTTSFIPGGGDMAPLSETMKQYSRNAAHIADGKRYYAWYNCSGCHFNGAGGIGPALMDDAWIYGDRIDQIFASIYEGRPGGMPSWGGKIPDKQIWEIAAFVESLPHSKAAQGPAPAKPPPAVMRSADGLDADPAIVHEVDK